MTITDNDSHVCTVVCDEGDLNWREQEETKIIKCRGQITGARDGDDMPCELNCTFKWSQLIQHTNESSDAVVPYEIINNLEDTFTSWDAGKFCLKWEFSVTSPDGTMSNGEKITFAKVYKESLDCKEGDEANTLAFSGKSLDPRPTVTRLT